MSLSGTRSRSPLRAGTTPQEDAFEQAIWAKFEDKLDAKNKHFKDEMKGVVGSLVNREVEKLESKIDNYQKTTDSNMTNLAKKQYELDKNARWIGSS